MGESWFYRESAEAPERGPVAKSDIDYLRLEGAIRPGMEIRSEFGEWSIVSGNKTSRSTSRSHSPAALPRTKTPVAKVAESITRAPASAPPVPHASPPAVKGLDTKKRIIFAAAILGAIALLMIFLLVASRGNQIQTAHSQDVASSSAGEAAESQTETADETGESTDDNEGTASTSEPILAGSESAEQSDSTLVGASESMSPSTEDTSVAVGSQPAPLNRNVKQNHILSGGAEFFGVRATGQRFVFLIDASSSMLDGKDVAARRELIASVKRMDSGMELEVIFFTNNVTRVFGGFKSLKNRTEVVADIQNANPVTGGTPVMPGLSEAIQMQPDAIFLLTDGDFNEGDISARVRSLNSESIPINTIAFVNRSMESVLKKVASDSGGDYRYVAR